MNDPKPFNATEELLVSCLKTVLTHIVYQYKLHAGPDETFTLDHETADFLYGMCFDVMQRVTEATKEALMQEIESAVAYLALFESLRGKLPDVIIEEMKRQHPLFRDMSLEPDVPDIFKGAIQDLDLSDLDDEESDDAE